MKTRVQFGGEIATTESISLSVSVLTVVADPMVNMFIYVMARE